MHTPPSPQWGIRFGMRGVIADVITRTKFIVNRFRGFGVLTPPVILLSPWSNLQLYMYARQMVKCGLARMRARSLGLVGLGLGIRLG